MSYKYSDIRCYQQSRIRHWKNLSLFLHIEVAESSAKKLNPVEMKSKNKLQETSGSIENET